jgi:hypothetical protein
MTDTDTVLDAYGETHTSFAPCTVCGEDIDPPKRVLLGYKVCLDCGDSTAKTERSTWTIVPTPKGHYTRITRKSDLLALNQKPR